MDKIIDFRSYAPIKATMDVIGDPKTPAGKYVSQYGLNDMQRNVMEPAAFEKHLDAMGIERCVIATGGAPAEQVVEYAQGSDRIIPIADVTPHNPIEAVRRIQRLYDAGARIVGLTPWKADIPANDRIWYPLYGKACELGMACLIHASFHFGRGLKLRTAHPMNLDDVAVHFPELTIIASHAGWPWIGDMIAVAWHNENVFIELSGWRFKYLPQENSGWEMLFQYANGPLKEKVVWGSLWPFLPLDRQIEEGQELPFKPEVRQAVFYDNPMRVLKACGAI